MTEELALEDELGLTRDNELEVVVPLLVTGDDPLEISWLDDIVVTLLIKEDDPLEAS